MLTAAQSRELGVFLTPEQKQQLDLFLMPILDDIEHDTYAMWALCWSGKDAVIKKQAYDVDRETGAVCLHTGDLIIGIKQAVKLQFGDDVFESSEISENNPMPLMCLFERLKVLDNTVSSLYCDTVLLIDEHRSTLSKMRLGTAARCATDAQRKQIRRMWESSYIDLRNFQ